MSITNSEIGKSKRRHRFSPANHSLTQFKFARGFSRAAMSSRRRASALEKRITLLATFALGPLAAACTLAALDPVGEDLGLFLLSLAVFAVSPRLVGFHGMVTTPAWLSMARAAAAIALATVVLLLATYLVHPAGLAATGWLLVLAAAWFFSLAPMVLAKRLISPAPPIRLAVIGSRVEAQDLVDELHDMRIDDYGIVGRISPDPIDRGIGGLVHPLVTEVDAISVLGTIDEAAQVADDLEIAYFVIGTSAPRLRVFETMLSSGLNPSVVISEVAAFCEAVFQHVPITEINAAWFQRVLDPRHEAGTPYWKRAMDLVIAGLAATLLAPMIGILALVIRSDGGPAIFRQVRVGENGQPFTLYKLRTMREGSENDPHWSSSEDPRITRIGKVLRGLHLDELPQLWNVVRGDMSIVGPRPEQPGYVRTLEQMIPFYTRRHLVRPGVTGWAQVRCGYAGTEVGSAWKMCHDLYYLKHRSPTLDLVIIFETFRAVIKDARNPHPTEVSRFARVAESERKATRTRTREAPRGAQPVSAE